MSTKRKVAFHSLGCKVNSYETDAMQQILVDNGYEIVPAFIDCKNVYDKNSLKQVDASIDFKTSLTLKNEEFNDEIINKINYAIIM